MLGNNPTGTFKIVQMFSAVTLAFANSLVTPAERDQIVRRAAFRGGIMKMENDVHDVAWASLVELIHCALTVL